MKAENRGKATGAVNKRMLTVQYTICSMDMDCPELMLSAQRHFCERCTYLLAEGYKPEKIEDELLEKCAGVRHGTFRSRK
jgi:hypothetical protein